MSINKNLVLLWILCSVFIVLAIAYKLDQAEDKPKIISVVENVAQEVIEASPVFYEINEEKESDENPKSTPTVKTSPISAKSYLVGNVKTGEIYIMKNSRIVLPVASMSKLITAIQSIDQFTVSGTTTVITISSTTPPDLLRFKNGEIFTINEALYPLLVNSSNIIAETLASTTDRNKFMDLMSSYAWEIGMPSTYFADPSGISPQNVSSASDFFALAKYLYNLRPDILTITKTPKYVLATTTEHEYHEINSTHPFVNDPNFLGGKTGRTLQARDTMLTILNIKNKPIAFIVLGSENRRKDTLYLISEVNKLLK